MLDQVLELVGIRPDHDLDIMRQGQSLTSVTTAVVDGLAPVIEQEKPDWLIVQGDTVTAMASALAGLYARIPIAHVEAGLRTGNLDAPYPEEANRRIVAVLAALHFAPTRISRDALLAEGVPAARVVLTGNTVVDALLAMRQRLLREPAVVGPLEAELPPRDDPRRIILVTAHRREHFDGGMENIGRALRAIADRGDCLVAFPVHPNPRVQAPMQAILAGHPNVLLLPPLGYLPFIRMLDRCHLVLTDSGGVQEEAPSFGKPVLVLRDMTERREALEAGTSRMVGTDTARIIAETARLLDDPAAYAAMAGAHNLYGDVQATQRIIQALIAATAERDELA